MWKIILLATLLTFNSQLGNAEDSPDCSNPQNQIEMNLCASQDFQKSDDALNLVWEDAKTNAENVDDTGEQSKVLLTAQRNWLSFRDSECEFEGLAAAGGTIQPLLILECKTKMTDERVKQLRAYIDGPE